MDPTTMAMASPPNGNACYEKMEEDLTCPVCLELYADPLMMACSHSICKTCLNDIKMSREKLGKTEFECPTCRNTHPITTDLFERLPKNLALENIVIRFQELKSTSLSRSEVLFDQSLSSPAESKSKESDNNDDVFDETLVDSPCGMCDDNQDKKAEWFCPQCDVLYCQGCLNTFHPRKGSLGRHKVCKPMKKKVVKVKTLYCSEHPSERASIFCDTCKLVACHLCVCQGQGSHGHHVIFDLNTAKEKTQASFTKVMEDLSVLISAFSLRDKEMDSQLDTIRSLHESAQIQITSQFQCFLSDATATLQLARNKFQEAIVSTSAKQAEPVETRRKQIKSALSRCSILMGRCNNLNHRYKDNRKGVITILPTKEEFRHSRARSLPQSFPLQTSNNNSSLSSSEESPNSSMADHRKGTKTKPRSKRSLSLLDQKEGQLTTQEVVANKIVTVRKSQEELFFERKSSTDQSTKKKELFDESRIVMTSTPIPQTDKKTCKPMISDKSSSVGSASVIAGSNDFDGVANKITEKTMHYKGNDNEDNRIEKEGDDSNRESDKRDSELNPPSQKKAVEDFRKGFLKSRGDDLAISAGMTELDEHQELNHEDVMLMQAAEVEEILEEIHHLTKELDQVVLGHEEELLNEVTQNLSSSLSSFSEVSVKLLSYLTTDTKLEVSEIPIMIPSVRSVASPLSPGQKGVPRFQSRTLITWGFNSTSFTAEPVESRGQWSVNITRNTSHIGDLKTGYLFGVGVARQSLASKEQVGMNPYSYGIVCSNGVVAFCHDSHVTPITLLSDLPLSIRLAVSSCHLGVVLSYWISPPGAMGTLHGKRVIALHRRNRTPDDDDGGGGSGASRVESADGSSPDKKEELSVDCTSVSSPTLPVFTVSQRVKMTFPVTSDES